MSNGLGDLVVEMYGRWIIAGLIVTGIFMLVALAGGFTSFLTELVTDSALGMIPFPFDLIATWSLNPLPVILQFVFTGLLFLVGR